jgi:hypothetical protein
MFSKSKFLFYSYYFGLIDMTYDTFSLRAMLWFLIKKFEKFFFEIAVKYNWLKSFVHSKINVKDKNHKIDFDKNQHLS